MIDDDAGPAELGGEVTTQDKLNLLRLQIRQAEEAAAKLPELIEQIKTKCPHQQVIEWLGMSNTNRYRICMCCGIWEKDHWVATSTQRHFTSELHNATPIHVSREFGENVRASPWVEHKLPVSV